jgi:PAS domain S-box-containing protein
MRALPDGICLVGGDGRILEVNEALCAMTGCTAEELLGQTPPYTFWPPEHVEEITTAFAASLTEPEGRFELTFLRADGARFPVRISSAALRQDEDGVSGFACVLRDATHEHAERVRLEEAQERLRQAQRVAGIGSFEVDRRTGEVTWSPELFRLLGLTPKDGTHDITVARALFEDPDGEQIRRVADATYADGGTRDLIHRYRRGDELRSGELRVEPLCTAEGERYGVRGTVQDVTDRVRAEQEIRLQARLLDAVDVIVVATDLAGLVTHWNGGAERALGWTRGEAVGRSVAELTMDSGDPHRIDAILAEIRRTGQWEGAMQLARRDGAALPSYLRAALFADPAGTPAGMVGVCVDVSEQLATERSLRAAGAYQQAITDNMGEGLFTVDTHGRLMYLNRAGEELLGWRSSELLGQVMHDVVHARRPDGSPCPPDACPLNHARARGEVVRIAEDLFIRHDDSELPVEVTSAPFETADGVRGSVVVFNDITERLEREAELQRQLDRVSWIGRLREALDEERFVLYAQPIVEVHSGETVQHELLIRLLDPSGTVIAPGDFLPTAEQYGLIAEIDRWVVREGIAYAAAGHPVELNLSAHSLATPALLEDVRDVLTRTGADPGLLVFELTETALMQDAAAAEHFIVGLRKLGCKVALDDFGTGYGGFTYLKRLPIDYLKIDREFVRDLTHSVASQEVVRAVVSLARGFGQKTVAEGVEDDLTMALLRELGVDFAQGYAIARPAPASAVLPGRD